MAVLGVLDLTFASMLLSAGGAERGLVAAHPARCHRTAATYGSTAVIGLSYDRVLSSSEASWEVRTGAMPRVAFSRLASIAAYIFASMAVRERGPNGRARRAHQDDASLVVHTPALGVPGVRHVSAGKRFQKMKPDFTASPLMKLDFNGVFELLSVRAVHWYACHLPKVKLQKLKSEKHAFGLPVERRKEGSQGP